MKYIIPIIFLLLISCTTTKYVDVPVETIKTEYINSTKVDSVYVKDSIDRYVKGDTVFIYKEHNRYKYLNNTDTIIKVDSIPKIIKVETIKTVEVNHIKWYQKFLMWIGGASLLILTGYTIHKIKIK